MKRTLLLAFTILLIVTGCKKNLSPANEQQVMFQMDYINYAWGYQHSGFLISEDGNILTYENPDKWNFPDGNFMLTGDQIAQNIQFSIKSGKRVPPDDLAKYGTYIENISLSKISGLKNTGNDAGTVQFICYKSSGSGNYKGTLIRMEGDFTCENLNFYSRKVVSWMREINTSLSSK